MKTPGETTAGQKDKQVLFHKILPFGVEQEQLSL